MDLGTVRKDPLYTALDALQEELKQRKLMGLTQLFGENAEELVFELKREIAKEEEEILDEVPFDEFLDIFEKANDAKPTKVEDEPDSLRTVREAIWRIRVELGQGENTLFGQVERWLERREKALYSYLEPFS